MDRNEEFPRPELVRKAARDGATYFGPYSSARGIRETVRELLRLFPMCSCTRRKFASRTRPCLNYQMGRCLGACAGLITRERYLPVVDDAVRFPGGSTGACCPVENGDEGPLRGDAVRGGREVRDRIAVVSKTLARQRVVRTVGGDVDAVGWHRDGPAVTAAVLYVRNGRLTDAHQRHFRWEGPEEEAIDSFLLHHYGEDAFFPGEILLPFPVADRAALSAALSERAGRTVAVRVPLRGERFRLVDIARRNAEEGARMRREKEEAYERVAERMADLFSLPGPPARIEGFDISNLSGTEAVGSMVAFLGGNPRRSAWKFSVRGVAGPDDFAMMEEVVGRRFAHDEDFGRMSADLVLIDGGKRAALLRGGGDAGRGQGGRPPSFPREGARPRRREDLPGAGVPARPEKPAPPPPQRPGAAPADARPRRGPPLRRHLPPHPPHPRRFLWRTNARRVAAQQSHNHDPGSRRASGLNDWLRRLGGRGSVRGSPCDEPARLRLTSLRPPSCGDSADPAVACDFRAVFPNATHSGRPCRGAHNAGGSPERRSLMQNRRRPEFFRSRMSL